MEELIASLSQLPAAGGGAAGGDVGGGDGRRAGCRYLE